MVNPSVAFEDARAVADRLFLHSLLTNHIPDGAELAAMKLDMLWAALLITCYLPRDF
jgi:hypothetical protein